MLADAGTDTYVINNTMQAFLSCNKALAMYSQRVWQGRCWTPPSPMWVLSIDSRAEEVHGFPSQLMTDLDVQLPSRIDPLAEELGTSHSKEDAGDTEQAGYVHVRVQQRNGRKSLTTVSVPGRAAARGVPEGCARARSSSMLLGSKSEKLLLGTLCWTPLRSLRCPQVQGLKAKFDYNKVLKALKKGARAQTHGPGQGSFSQTGSKA
eukprot:1137992-Pelagomonas_calceolata.AAC.6